MKMTSCPACTKPAGRQHRPTEMMYGTGEQFDYCECSECGTLWLADIPADLSPFYANSYYSADLDPEDVFANPAVRAFTQIVGRSALLGANPVTRLPATSATSLIGQRQFQTLMALFRSVARAGLVRGARTRVLDVGCGSGISVAALALGGVQQTLGIDPFAAESRTLSMGGEVRKASISDVNGQFELIMFHHSFEHMPNPEHTLQECRRLLSPSGRVLIRVPTVSSAAYSLYGTKWIQWDPPRHLSLFSREGMELLANRCLWKIESCVDDSSGFSFWGSEQAQRGIPLFSPTSFAVSPSESQFSASQISSYNRLAKEVNRISWGDQAAWTMTPSS